MPSKSNVISKKLSDYRKLNFYQIYIIIDILIILCDVLSKVILMICRYDAIIKSYVLIEFLNMIVMVFGFLKTIFLKRCIKRLFFFNYLSPIHAKLWQNEHRSMTSIKYINTSLCHTCKAVIVNES